MSLTLLQIEIVPQPLFEWARQTGIPMTDRGYLAHSAMRAVFGDAAPQPFALFGNADNPKLKVLGYARTGKEALRAGLALAEPILTNAFPAEGLLDKAMPEAFPAGLELRFRVDCCPVTRNQDKDGRMREKDAFLAACDAHPEGGVDRAGVYVAWLAAELARDGAAQMLEGKLKGFALFRPVRRADASARARQTGQRPRASLGGRLRVERPEAFMSLLGRGIGRHRAFGLGMLLLSPT